MFQIGSYLKIIFEKMFKIFMADVFINSFKNIIINDLNSLTNIKIAEILERKKKK